MLPPIAKRIAEELGVNTSQVEAAIGLLDEGATVPFIARYRKEVTNGLDDIQLRTLEERLGYLRDLEDRRLVVLKSLEEQDKLTPALKNEVLSAETKTRLEDVYLPYKPKRRTKAQMAREAGLFPMVESLLDDRTQSPEGLAVEYINEEAGFSDIKSVLEGGRQILMETWAEDAELSGEVRDWLWVNAELKSSVMEGKEKEGAKFSDYFDFAQAINKIPSHRALALFRARNEGFIFLDMKIEDDEMGSSHPERLIAQRFGIRDEGNAADSWLRECVRFTWRIKLFTRLDLELKTRLREAAEAEAIKVFANNLNDLLLAAPAGPRATLGLDPGLRTGVKVAVVDGTGKVLATDTIYPHAPKKQWDQSLATLAKLIEMHHVDLIAIGNGTASRETDKLSAELLNRYPEFRLNKIMVSEAGASVYSASELASNELPDMDVSLRGAVSIARRLQDPLAELVKIDPKSIGVGQYQHDVSQVQLARSLNNVVEDCVNAVGVDVNTASPALLARVSGLSASVADNIVQFRDQNGAFANREQLKSVPWLGDKTYEQAAGFLRVMNGSNPLDSSAVHPEAYPVVEKILAKHNLPMRKVIGDGAFLRRLDVVDYTDEKFGAPTVQDIIAELEKPGRDPRPEFKTAEFQDGIEKLSDLKVGMVLEGVITNVTNFGAFVDVGVHQDGLVHISSMSDKFIKDPREMVKAGQVVKVKIMEVDLDRKRVGLSMRLSDEPGKPAAKRESRKPNKAAIRKKSRDSTPQGGAFAAAFAKAKNG